MHRQAPPVLVDAHGTTRLERVAPDTRGDDRYNERWIQELVDQQPRVLPIAAIEPAFWPAVAVCMELPLRSGFLDNLLVTPAGDLIAVECKLWRNVEARREVLAQVIDYAKDLQAIGYSDLEAAIRKARKEPAYSLYAHATAGAEPDRSFDEPGFVDAVSHNLRRARCLLLIVGDGISENMEGLTEYLQQHAGLHFALALVQLAVYRLPGSDQRLVVPSVPMRTTTLVRGIVLVRDGNVTIEPPPTTRRAAQATTLTEEELFGSLDRLRPGTSERLLTWLSSLEDLQVTWDVRKTLIVRMIQGEQRAVPFVIDANGVADTGYSSSRKELPKSFAETLARTIPGTTVKETAATWYVPRRKKDGTLLTVWDLLDHQAGCRTALEQLNSAMRAVGAELP